MINKKRFWSSFKSYVAIARLDHWFKNMFMIPGALIAYAITGALPPSLWFNCIIGICSACLAASANYVLNEWLDAETDKFHPLKKDRPSVLGNVTATGVYIEYVVLIVLSLALSLLISRAFSFTMATLMIMAVLYNVKPFRTKDKIYLDVLSESINNPIRLLGGWFLIVNGLLPPSSILISYWMGGAFLMGIKRYAEYRFIGDKNLAGDYRKSFKYYTESILLISTMFYSMCSLFFMGIFLVKYKIELIFIVPMLAVLFCWYAHIGMKVNSVAQHPEKLYRERSLFYYILFLSVVFIMLLNINMPWLDWFLNRSIVF